MLNVFLCTVLAVQTLFSGLSDPSFRTAAALKTGVTLRLHVVAQDDSESMQALKLAVRDGVRAEFARLPRDPADTMLTQAEKLMPDLTRAAQETAAAHGFDRPVTVLLGWFDFDRRDADGLIIPAGRYPALVIQLGDAQGHNWWGLLDPAASWTAAAISDSSQPILWNWSWQGFLDALLQFPVKAGEQHG